METNTLTTQESTPNPISTPPPPITREIIKSETPVWYVPIIQKWAADTPITLFAFALLWYLMHDLKKEITAIHMCLDEIKKNLWKK